MRHLNGVASVVFPALLLTNFAFAVPQLNLSSGALTNGETYTKVAGTRVPAGGTAQDLALGAESNAVTLTPVANPISNFSPASQFQATATGSSVTSNFLNPPSNVWGTLALSTTGSSSVRSVHAAAWTGSKLFVWGGTNGSVVYNTGGLFDPVANSWTSTTTTNAPVGREGPEAIYMPELTTPTVLVWGGDNGGATLYNSGAQYDPAADSWSATTTTSAPVPRNTFALVWTGSKAIIWAGCSGRNGAGNCQSSVNTGGQYDPSANSWTATTTTGVPPRRFWGAAVWTGSKMVAWGGDLGGGLNSGGQYDPSTNAWTTMTTTGAPSPRYGAGLVWTGSKMIAWGGNNGTTTYYNDGGQYDPSTNAWTSMTTTGAPGVRRHPIFVWSGSKAIGWGGINGSYVNTGGQYDPTANSWTSMTTSGAPSQRVSSYLGAWSTYGNGAALVWGGYDGSSYFNNGGIYFP